MKRSNYCVMESALLGRTSDRHAESEMQAMLDELGG